MKISGISTFRSTNQMSVEQIERMLGLTAVDAMTAAIRFARAKNMMIKTDDLVEVVVIVEVE